jgi:hypothetical protein
MPALPVILQGGFASDVGQQALVAALASSMPALRQLVLLLEHCGKVQVAAAQQQEQQKDQVRLVLLAWTCHARFAERPTA